MLLRAVFCPPLPPQPRATLEVVEKIGTEPPHTITSRSVVGILGLAVRQVVTLALGRRILVAAVAPVQPRWPRDCPILIETVIASGDGRHLLAVVSLVVFGQLGKPVSKAPLCAEIGEAAVGESWGCSSESLDRLNCSGSVSDW